MVFLKNFVSFFHRHCKAKPKQSTPENGLPRRFAPRNDGKVFCGILFLSLLLTHPAHAVCTGPDGDHGDMLYNLDHTVMQYCNGTNWVSMDASRAAGGGGIPADPTDCTDRAPVSLVWDASTTRIIGTCMDTTPDNFSFNDLIDQTPNALVISNIVAIIGITGPANVLIEGDGSPAYRICATSNCSSVVQDWSTSAGTVTNNQFIQIRLTASGDISATRGATVRIGQASDRWDVKTVNVQYATAKLATGNKNIAFVAIPASITINSNTDYKAFCESRGFKQNQNASTQTIYTEAQMQSSTEYYCNSHCCYLGSGNTQANNLSGFQNFGLPLNTNLRVRDRGCGNYGGGFVQGQNTTDSLRATGTNAFTYTADAFGSADYGQTSSPSSFEGVIVCQMP